MKLRLPKMPKMNIKLRLPKRPERKNKKKRLLVLIILFLVLIVLAGIGFSRFLLKDKVPDKNATEGIQSEQNQDNEKEKDTETDTENEKDTDTDLDTGNFENHLASDFIKILKSGEYMIRYKTTTVYKGQSFVVETTYAVADNSIALISGDRATIVKDNRVYMLNHTDKTMLNWNVNPSSGELNRIDTEELTFIGSTSENGLVCEEYKTESSNLKLYFNEKTLEKIVTVINGQDTAMDILEVSKEVPESIFEVPQSYESEEL